MKKIISILIRISVSALLLIFLFKQVDKKALWRIIIGANRLFLFLAFFIFFLSYVLGIYRWKKLLDAEGLSLSFARVTISFCGGLFFNLFLPSTIGGDLIKGFDLALYTRKPKEVVSTVLVDRLGGYTGMVIITLVALLFGYRFINDTSLLIIIGIITLVLVSAFLVLFNHFVFDKINKFLGSAKSGKIRLALQSLHGEIYRFKERKVVLLNNLLLSLIIQVSAPIIFYITALSLGLKTEIIYFLILIPIIGAITMLPISIGGLGLRDATTIFFFAKVGIAKDISFAISLLGFFYVLIISVIGGIIYVFTLHTRRLQYNQAS